MLVLEDLTHIRENRDYGAFLNRRLHGWGFAKMHVQLRYKTTENRIRVETVKPAYTSKSCLRVESVRLKSNGRIPRRSRRGRDQSFGPERSGLFVCARTLQAIRAREHELRPSSEQVAYLKRALQNYSGCVCCSTRYHGGIAVLLIIATNYS